MLGEVLRKRAAAPALSVVGSSTRLSRLTVLDRLANPRWSWATGWCPCDLGTLDNVSMTKGSTAGAGDLAVLITGARGQLGRALSTAAAAEQIRADCRGSAELDITDANAVDDAVAELAAGGGRPVVINAAAYTAVDPLRPTPQRPTRATRPALVISQSRPLGTTSD